MDWGKEEIKFLVDGEVYFSYPIVGEKANFGADIHDGIDGFHDFHRLIINNEIFSEKTGWAPEGGRLTEEDAATMPIDYWVDYVRLYQDPETEKILLKEDLEKAKAAHEAKNK
jgi:hypothetical protein